jgi:hypothetical protein
LSCLGPGDIRDYQHGGREVQFFAGVKMGFRHDRYGVFAKLRPGLATFNNTVNDIRAQPPASALWTILLLMPEAFWSSIPLGTLWPNSMSAR